MPSSTTRHDKRKAEGRCWDCGSENPGPYRRCDPCRTKFNRQRHESRLERKLDRLCWDCGGKTIANYVRCVACHAKAAQAKAAMYVRRRELGLCRDCGELAPNVHRRCQVHMDVQGRYRKQRRREAKAAGFGMDIMADDGEGEGMADDVIVGGAGTPDPHLPSTWEVS